VDTLAVLVVSCGVVEVEVVGWGVVEVEVVGWGVVEVEVVGSVQALAPALLNVFPVQFWGLCRFCPSQYIPAGQIKHLH